MSYTIDVTCALVSAYTEEDEWMDGDTRELEPSHAHSLAYDPSEDGDSPRDWAIETLRDMASFEPSSYPIGPVARPHEGLHASQDDDNYSGPGRRMRETSAYLNGDWTDAERADVFRGATA